VESGLEERRCAARIGVARCDCPHAGSVARNVQG
jgi:hypothetical protein